VLEVFKNVKPLWGFGLMINKTPVIYGLREAEHF
jgi:hypothetical protein